MNVAGGSVPNGFPFDPADPAVIELLPESIARENCVLPVSHDGKSLHVLLPDDEARNADVIDKLEFILDCDITVTTADRGELERLIDLRYRSAWGTVENCTLEFAFRCPKKWIELEPTDNERVRHCTVCGKDVYFCTNRAEIVLLASKQQCVAYSDGADAVVSMGLLDFPETPCEPRTLRRDKLDVENEISLTAISPTECRIDCSIPGWLNGFALTARDGAEALYLTMMSDLRKITASLPRADQSVDELKLLIPSIENRIHEFHRRFSLHTPDPASLQSR